MKEPISRAQWAQMSQLTKVSPVGQYITRSPVGSDGMLSTCDSDQPVADGPVGSSVSLGLVGPRRTLSQCKPVGQSSGPVVYTQPGGPVWDIIQL